MYISDIYKNKIKISITKFIKNLNFDNKFYRNLNFYNKL